MVATLNLGVATAGLGWLLIGGLLYVGFRRSRGLDLTTTHKVAIPQPVVDHEAEYDSVLVALNTDDGYDEHLLATAARLAARKRRGIHVLVSIPVPLALTVDARMPEVERAADSMIEQARIHGGRRVSGHWEKVRPGQAARRLIEEAEDMRASAVVISPRDASPAPRSSGKTVETLLAERPCRIVIDSSNQDAGQRAAAAVANSTRS